jgi:hypothetical protein
MASPLPYHLTKLYRQMSGVVITVSNRPAVRESIGSVPMRGAAESSSALSIRT